jgi:hypothetical protein
VLLQLQVPPLLIVQREVLENPLRMQDLHELGGHGFHPIRAGDLAWL